MNSTPSLQLRDDRISANPVFNVSYELGFGEGLSRLGTQGPGIYRAVESRMAHAIRRSWEGIIIFKSPD